MTMLLELASCEVKKLLSSRRRRLYQPLMLGLRNSERSKNLDQAHTVDSAYNVSPQRQHSASLQELQHVVRKEACPDLWR